MAAKKAQELGWQPTMFVINTTSGVNKILKESGGGLPEGSITSLWHKNPADPAWANDPAMVEWKAFMKKYYPEGDTNESNCVLATCFAQAMFHVLKACGQRPARREHPERRTKPQRRAAAIAAAGDHPEYLPHRLLPDRAVATDPDRKGRLEVIRLRRQRLKPEKPKELKMSGDALLVEDIGAVRKITFNRPQTSKSAQL